MTVKDFLKKEFEGFNKLEILLFVGILILTATISIIAKDSKIALISAICGMSYTILAGKGRISCYFIGITGTFCYCYLSYKNGFYGNLMLYGLYYLPMEIIGIFAWKKHLKKEKQEIIKTKLNKKEKIIYFSLAICLTVLLTVILNYNGGNSPAIDGFTVSFSILAQYLTVKRCIEQWYIWFFVNLFSLVMWFFAYLNGSNCLATVIMWFVYLLLAVYFLKIWQKEINQTNC